MERYTPNRYFKRYIKRKTSEFCKALSLPDIQIKYNLYGDICFLSELTRDEKTLVSGVLCFDLLRLAKILKEKNNFIFNLHKIKGLNNKICFIIGHEIGHYLTSQKNLKYLVKTFHFVIKNEIFLTQEKYRKIPCEKFADKIALYLIKKVGTK